MSIFKKLLLTAIAISAILYIPAALFRPQDQANNKTARPKILKKYPATLLWKIEKNGYRASYLWGTMHLARKEVATLPTKVLDKIAATEVTVGEITFPQDITGMLSLLNTTMKLMVAPGNKSLKKEMDPELYTQFSKMIMQKGKTPEMVDKQVPYFIISFFYPSDPGVLPMDFNIQLRARLLNKPVKGLETIEEQADLLTSLPYAQQVKMLEEFVKDTQAFYTEMETMTKAYTSRNLTKLYQKILAEAEKSETPEFHKKMFQQRNKIMVKRMLPMMKQSSLFVAVGAGHLPGPDGIITLLREKGFSVTPVFTGEDNRKKPEPSEFDRVFEKKDTTAEKVSGTVPVFHTKKTAA